MEAKEQKCEVCCSCGYFVRYYTKGLYKFNITKQGFCKMRQNIVKSSDCCELWQSNNKRLSLEKRVSMKVLSELLMSVSAIRQVLEEENEEEN